MFHAKSLTNFSEDEENAFSMLEELARSLRRQSFSPELPSSRTPQSPDLNNPTPSHFRNLTPLTFWTASTAKAGSGIEQLLDGKAATYWQSDGPQTHMISAQFSCKLKVSSIQIYLDYAGDESYATTMVSVNAVANTQYLRLARKIRKLEAPQGWITIPLYGRPDLCDEISDDGEEVDDAYIDLSPDETAARSLRRFERANRRDIKPLQRQKKLDGLWIARSAVNGHLEARKYFGVTNTNMVQLVIHFNHQKGRDSHIRMIRALVRNTRLPLHHPSVHRDNSRCMNLFANSFSYAGFLTTYSQSWQSWRIKLWAVHHYNKLVLVLQEIWS